MTFDTNRIHLFLKNQILKIKDESEEWDEWTVRTPERTESETSRRGER